MLVLSMQLLRRDNGGGQFVVRWGLRVGGGEMSRILSAFGGGAAVTLVIAVGGVWLTQQVPARAGEPDAQAGAQGQAAVPVERDGFVKEVERRLKGCRERIAVIGGALLAEMVDRSATGVDSLKQGINVESAKVEFGNATLAREVAEIAALEYEHGIFLQDQATAVAEIKLAESELGRARDRIELSKTRLARIKEVSKGSAADVALEYTYEDNIADAERRESEARRSLDAARAKLKVLEEFTKAKVIKQLRSEVAKARSDELAKKATWQLEEGKLKRVNGAQKSEGTGLASGELLPLLTRAFALDEKIRTEMGQLAKNGSSEGHAEAIKNLISQLETLIAQAESEHAALLVDRLKSPIHAAASRSGSSKQ
jgi:hypothetical protein